jgi:prolyl-tRNA synthetase
MGSYGIGLGRVMATAVEVHNDKNGIIWPKAVAPFAVHLIELPGKSKEASKQAESAYQALREAKIEVLFDDRAVSPGEKFAGSDLIGIPYRVVVSEKSVKDAAKPLELKKRDEKTAKSVSLKELLEIVR